MRREMLLNAISQALQTLFPLIVLAVGSRNLSAEIFTDLATFTYVYALLITVVGFGFEVPLVKKFVEAKESITKLSLLYSLLVVAQFILLLICSIFIFFGISFVSIELDIVIFALVAAFFFAICPPWLIMILGLNKNNVIFSIFIRGMGIFLIFMFNWTSYNQLIGLLTITFCLTNAFGFIQLRSFGLRFSSITSSSQWHNLVRLFKDSAGIFTARVSASTYTTMIPLTVTQVADPILAQAFIVADKLRNILQYGIGALIPVFNRFYLSTMKNKNSLKKAYLYGAVFIIISIFISLLLAEQLMIFLGSSSDVNLYIFAILIWCPLFSYGSNYFGILRLFYEGYEKSYYVPLLCVGIFAIILNKLAIDYFGVIGSASLLLSCEILIFLAFLFNNLIKFKEK